MRLGVLVRAVLRDRRSPPGLAVAATDEPRQDVVPLQRGVVLAGWSGRLRPDRSQARTASVPIGHAVNVPKWVEEFRHPNAAEIAEACVMAPRNVWLGTGAPLDVAYPCRCHERRGKACSPAWCPCAGRPDPLLPTCCGHRFTPQDHITSLREWQAKRDRQARGEE